MTTEYFFMNFIVLVILVIVAVIASGVFAFLFNDDKEKKYLVGSILCGILAVAGVVWGGFSANDPWRPELTTLHEVKDVTFPDGSKVQMFTCDNVHHNVTSMFGKVIEPKDWVVRRVRWSPLSRGISWNGSSTRLNSGDCYFLEHKRGEQPSVEIKDKPVTATTPNQVIDTSK